MKILEFLEDLWHKKVTRKEFLKHCVQVGACAGGAVYALDLVGRYKSFAKIGERRGMHEAMFYQKMGDSVKCLLCDNYCVLSNGQRGFCRAREPVDGKLYSLVYELICSVHIDPIEKKPMYHMLPGSKSLSIATAGCNSRCKYCQNWTISQRSPEETQNRRLSVPNLVTSAANNGCKSIAYTYTEPIVFYEYVLEASKLAKQRGIYNIAVTGGKINPEPAKRWAKYVHAANIDFKGFDDKYLREVCAQNLNNILEAIVTMKKEGMWIELTNLIVPTLNDDMGKIRKMCKWIRTNLGPDVPLHFSRFWPQYKLRSLYPTPVETLVKARDIALSEGINYVYVGNVPGKGFENTVCPKCKKVVIKRMGYRVIENHVSSNGTCEFCGNKIAGIWK